MTRNIIIRWILYLAGKDNNLLDGASSLVLQELLNDVSANVTSPNDGKVCVSRHELMFSVVTVCVILGATVAIYLSITYYNVGDVTLTKLLGSSVRYLRCDWGIQQVCT